MALVDFPALVRLSEGVGDFSYADCRQPKGGDVRFTRGDGVELASECVVWNPSGESQFWVRVPELTAECEIYMVWGNVDAQARAQVPAVWNESYTAVWPLENAGPAIVDASGSGNHGSASRTLASVPGVVGAARSFSESAKDYARAGTGYDDSFSSPSFTYEGWFKTEENPASQRSLFGYSVQNGNYNSAAILRDIQLEKTGKIVFRLENRSYTSTATAEPGSWHYVAATYDAGTKDYALYLDGAVAVSGTFNGNNKAYDPLNRFQFANANHLGQKLFFDGALDELRISRLVRPAAYFAAVHKNLTDTANFIRITAFGDKPLPTVEPLPAQTVTISLSAEAGGTVSPAGDVVVEKGGFLEVTASYPTDDRLFYAWGGDCPTTSVFSATIRVPADRNRTLTARFGTAYRISPSAETDAIKAGLDQIAADADADPSVLPAVLQLADGTYPLTNPYVKSGYAYTISTPIAVRAATVGNAILDFKGVDGKICEGRSAFKLDSLGAVIDGLAFVNASEHAAYSDNAVVAFVNKGHLLNCTVDAFRERSDSDCCVKVNAGWISRCSFLDATSAQEGTRTYPITLAGGTLMDSCTVSNFCGSMATVSLAGRARNCLFVNCSAKHASNGRGGAIQFFHANGGNGVTAIAENCTFINCSAFYGGALAYAQGSVWPVAINCAFLDNKAANTAQGHDVHQVTLVNCVSSSAAAVDGNIVSLPVFTETFGEPAAISPTRNAGLYARWVAQGEGTDLVGANRLDEGALDIGCREFPKPSREPLAVNVMATAYEGRDTLETTFTTTVTGDRTGLTYAWDFGDGSTGSTDAEPTHTYATCGYYTVTLTVSNGAGESSVFTKESFIRVLPSRCYVRAAGESVPTAPYATPETAADKLCDVLSVMPATIDVGEGSIPLGKTIRLNYGVCVVGAGPDKTMLTAGGCDMGASNFYVEHEDAVLTGVCVDNPWCNWGTMMSLSDGVISNCVFRKCGSNYTGTMFMLGGRLVDCRFDQCWSPHAGIGGVLVTGSDAVIERCVFSGLSGMSSGVAIRVQDTTSPGPTIRNCLLEGSKSTGVNVAAAVYCASPAVIENCTIAGNKMEYGAKAGGLYLAANDVEVRNTIVWGNTVHATNIVEGIDGTVVTNIGWNAVDVAVAADKSVVFSHSCAPELADVATCLAEDPKYNAGRKSKLPYYAILGSSPCKNTGVKLDWMTDEATDIIGNPRVFGGMPDIGCYESLSSGLTLIVR